jgi:D-amino-acid dehydrogenase
MRTQIPPGGRLVVVGAGIVGVCCAIELAEAGYQVELIDRAEPGKTGPSKANAGHIADASILPLASPATFRNIPSLLTSRQSPLYVPWRYGFQILPWLGRFALSCRPHSFANGVKALADLNSILWPCTEDLYQRANIRDQLTKSGALFLYETPASFYAAQKAWTFSATYGVHTETVAAEQLPTLEPHLSRSFTGAVRANTWGVVSDPLRIVVGLCAYAISKGVLLTQANVTNVIPSDGDVALDLGGGNPLQADGVIIAAGAWSNVLVKQLGQSVPLEVERGYNITFSDPNTAINHALVFADRGMVATQLSGGLRIGGLDELGGLDLPENPALHQRVLETSEDLFSGLDTKDATPWMGHRPSTPDSLPIIGPAKISDRIFYAFGHGHYGLTHAPTTGKLIADLVSATPTMIDTKQFSADRFM